MAKLDLDAIFTYHAPFGNQAERYAELRDMALSFAEEIVRMTPASREQSLAITSLQQTTMWANAAIAINEKPEPVPVEEVASV